MPPLPHHRAYGSVPRRFERAKLWQRHRRSVGLAVPLVPDSEAAILGEYDNALPVTVLSG